VPLPSIFSGAVAKKSYKNANMNFALFVPPSVCDKSKATERIAIEFRAGNWSIHLNYG
jgi:hypothetical protein